MAGPPVYVAGSLTAVGVASATTIVFNKPTGLQVGDVLVVRLRAANTAAALTVPSGWVVPVGLPATDRMQGIAYKVIADATALAAEAVISTYTFTVSATAGRIIGDIGILRGVSPSTPIAGTSAYVNSANITAFSTTTTPYTVMGLWGDERTAGRSHVISPVPTGFTTSQNAQNTLDASTSSSRTAMYAGILEVPRGGSTSVASVGLTWPGGVTAQRALAVAFAGVPGATLTSGGYDFTGTLVGKRVPSASLTSGSYTYSGNPVGLRPAAGANTAVLAPGSYAFAGGNLAGKETPRATLATGSYAFAGNPAGVRPIPPGFPTVSHFLATPGATIAHRDIGTVNTALSSYIEGAQAGHGILEFSCGWTSDLVPFAHGEQYLDNQSQVTGNVDPKTMTWAFLQANYQIVLNAGGNPQPYLSLQEALDYFPNHLFTVDPKYGVLNPNLYMPAMLDILDANGGPSRFIIKFDSSGSGSIPIATHAHARGYIAMNYWGTNTASMATEQSNWDLIGALYSDATAIAQANTYGKPSWGAIATTQAHYNTTRSYGADFVMVGSPTVTAVGYTGGKVGTLASGSYAFNGGTLAGKQTPRATLASGTYSFAGNPAGKESPRAPLAAGAYTFAGGTLVGKEIPRATLAAGSYTYSGLPAGKEAPRAALTAGGFAFAGGQMTGFSPTPGLQQGILTTGTYSFSGNPAGKRTTRNTLAAGGFAFTGNPVGRENPRAPLVTAGYDFAVALPAGARAARAALAVTAYALDATALVGLRPAEPGAWDIPDERGLIVSAPRYRLTVSAPGYTLQASRILEGTPSQNLTLTVTGETP